MSSTSRSPRRSADRGNDEQCWLCIDPIADLPQPRPMIIRDATLDDYAAVAGLMRAFIEWHYQRHANDRHIIDSYLDPQKFEAALRSLPGDFAAPDGALLVAEEQGRVGGCVALRKLGGSSCEMKRMFVAADMHGKGIGDALARTIIARASDIGYSKMLLDTGPAQREAQGLYRKHGFRDVAPYYELSSELQD